jgi:hypothetical protein
MADEPTPSASDQRGTSRNYILNRLKREGRSDLIPAIEDGQVSAYAVAESFGWITRPAVAGTGSENQAKRRAHRLSALQELGISELTADQEMSLWLGVGPRHNLHPFASDDERRAAWFKHRDRLIGTLPSTPGRRPMAFWQYDAPDLGLRWPGYEHEQEALYEAGLLQGAEREALEAEWRGTKRPRRRTEIPRTARSLA